jgi:hypothetical protein
MYAEGVRSLSQQHIVKEFTFSVSVSRKCCRASYRTEKQNMNTTHEKLFVRGNIKTKNKVYRDVKSKYDRSIKTVAQINEYILLADMTVKSSNGKLLEKDNAESLHKEMKPLLIVLRLLGCFPVYFFKSV